MSSGMLISIIVFVSFINRLIDISINRASPGIYPIQNIKQEAHGPWVTHLSDIATADMQMLCNIFPILSSQLMKRSSFKQFFILKKKIYSMPVN